MRRLDLNGLDDPVGLKATDMLEGGGLVVLPTLAFEVDSSERTFLDPAILKRGVKNVSLDPASGRLAGALVAPERIAALAAMLARYAQFARTVLTAITPGYISALQDGRTTFRPGPVDSRVLSPRRDDRRLHFDAFGSKPLQGRRILRVFTNVDPHGRDRVWEVGEDTLEQVVQQRRPRFAEPGLAVRAQERVGLIRSRRSAYDAVMLALHDGSKLDDAWQSSAARTRVSFPPRATWAVFTDGVLHAALSGQNAFEQTWYLPVEAMAEPERSPLRRLERLAGRALV